MKIPAETALTKSLDAFDELLAQRGIKHAIFKSEGAMHEWHAWRRDPDDFAPRLFSPEVRRDQVGRTT
jgi:S-formylglutathione hydrolase FrmB